MEQTRPPDSRYQIGAGKVEELARMVEETGADKIIFDNVTSHNASLQPGKSN